MTDWAIAYFKHVLESKKWTAAELARKAGVAASTINRPLADPQYSMGISRKTISAVALASGVDPSPFATEATAVAHTRKIGEYFEAPAESAADSAPDIKIWVHGRIANIIATVDRQSISRLRARLDAIEALLDD